MARLGDVAEILRGVTFKPDQLVESDTAGSVVCLRTKNVQSELDWSDVLFIPRHVVSNPRQYVHPGDIIVSSANSWNLVGKCAWVGDVARPTTFGGFVSNLRVTSADVDARYVYRWFSSPRTQALVRSFGQKTTSISNLNIARTLGLEVPLPPLPEQRRIASLLDRVDSIRWVRRTALEVPSDFTAGFLQDVLSTDPPERELGEIFEVSGGKRLPKGAPYADGRTPHPYLRVSDMKDGGFNAEDLKYLTPDVHQRIGRYVVDADDLVISIAGSIGLVSQVPPELAGSNLTENAARLRPRNSDQTLAAFYQSQLSSPLVQIQIRNATGQATIGKLPLFRVEKLRVKEPSAEQQREYVAKVQAVRALRLRHETHLSHLDELFAAMEHRAFAVRLP